TVRQCDEDLFREIAMLSEIEKIGVNEVVETANFGDASLHMNVNGMENEILSSSSSLTSSSWTDISLKMKELGPDGEKQSKEAKDEDVQVIKHESNFDSICYLFSITMCKYNDMNLAKQVDGSPCEGEGDWRTINSIVSLLTNPSSPKETSNFILPSGFMTSHEKPTKVFPLDSAEGYIWVPHVGCNFLLSDNRYGDCIDDDLLRMKPLGVCHFCVPNGVISYMSWDFPAWKFTTPCPQYSGSSHEPFVEFRPFIDAARRKPVEPPLGCPIQHVLEHSAPHRHWSFFRICGSGESTNVIIRICRSVMHFHIDPLLPLRSKCHRLNPKKWVCRNLIVVDMFLYQGLEGIQMSLDKAMCVGRDFTVSPTPPGLTACACEVLGSLQGGIWSRTGHFISLVD
nr:nuclease associated modular domain 3 [Tanacetum cinerariifolium]